MCASLAEQFSGLIFAQSADHWLANIGKRNIAQQLFSRKIHYLGHTFSSAGYLCVHKDHFLVLRNPELTFRERCKTIGHEIGHTFHCCLKSSPPRPLLCEDDDPSFWNNVIEPFCEVFGERRLALNGSQKFLDFSREDSKRFFEWQ